MFFGVVVLLLPILREGPTPERLRRLAEAFAVSPRTLLRWQQWWREVVPRSRFWEATRGGFALPVAVETLPGSLLAAFSESAEPTQRVLSVLRWLSLLPSGLGLCGHRL